MPELVPVRSPMESHPHFWWFLVTTQHCGFQGGSSDNQVCVRLFRTRLKLVPLLQKLHGTWAKAERGLEDFCSEGPLHHAVPQLIISPPSAAQAKIQNYRSSCMQYGGIPTLSWKHKSASLLESRRLTTQQAPGGSLTAELQEELCFSRAAPTVPLWASSKEEQAPFSPEVWRKRDAFSAGLLTSHIKSLMS